MFDCSLWGVKNQLYLFLFKGWKNHFSTSSIVKGGNSIVFEAGANSVSKNEYPHPKTKKKKAKYDMATFRLWFISCELPKGSK